MDLGMGKKRRKLLQFAIFNYSIRIYYYLIMKTWPSSVQIKIRATTNSHFHKTACGIRKISSLPILTY